MLTLKDGRTELWQWDTGRELKVEGECSQIHFSNKIQGRSIDVDVVDGVAKIPDVLLQTDGTLNAWAFVGAAENGYTKVSKSFVVNKRNRPADYVFTPTDQTSVKELNDRLEKLETNQDPEAVGNAVKEYLENNPIKEEDPTVPQWAKEKEKPTYTADEVGALPNTTKIPSKTSELTNDSGFLTQHQDLSAYAKTSQIPTKVSQLTNDKNYLTTVPSEYVTETELTGKGYATQTSVNNLSKEIVNLNENKQPKGNYALKEEIPTHLPNPNALTFTGAATGTYDGSAPLTVNIPEGGGGTGGEFRLLGTIQLTPDVTSYTFNTDVDGNAFFVSELYLSSNDAQTSGGGYIEFNFPNIAFSNQVAPWSNSAFLLHIAVLCENKAIVEYVYPTNKAALFNPPYAKIKGKTISDIKLWFSGGITVAGTITVYGR